MRYMADADVLFDKDRQSDAEKALEGLGYRKYGESLCEVIYENDNLHLELHKELIPPDIKELYAYFKDPFARALKVSGCEHHFSDDDHFIYIFVHFARHYRGGGIGLKHLCDLFVCKEKLTLNADYIEAEMEKLGLLSFYHNAMAACAAAFGEGEASEITDRILNTIFDSGAYGTAKNVRLSDSARRSGGGSARRAKTSRFLWSLFLPYKIMCIKYPFLRRAPFLLPIMWVVRAVCSLFKGNSRAKAELRELKGLTNDELKNYIEGLRLVGLSFDF